MVIEVFPHMGSLFSTVHALFSTVHVLKNIKNESHDTIYTFKNYFATVFSVFSFQFSATISSIQTDLRVNGYKNKQMEN